MKEPELIEICPKCDHKLERTDSDYFIGLRCMNPICLDHCYVFIRDCCSKPNYQVRKLITTSGSIQVREQCLNCGKVKSNSLGGYTTEQKAALEPISDWLRQSRYDEYYKHVREYREAYILIQQEARKKAWDRAYDNYLSSGEWKTKREMVLKRDHYLCQSCLFKKATQVHHKSYEFVDFTGREPCFDLVSICTDCHQHLHEIRNQRKAS